jgi:hypothetical protein
MHLAYTCRQSGVCCTSGWPIPIERVRAERLIVAGFGGTWLRPAPEGAPPEYAGLIAHDERGRCVFYRGACEIQRRAGHAALPSACQHFPREVLIDSRGAHVTLSHYCPTAADLLFSHVGPVEIVEGPPAVPAGEPEGLDARAVLPPRLTSTVLMDADGYAAWEAHMVRVLTRDDGETPEQALDRLDRNLRDIQRWRPGERTLTSAIQQITRAEMADTAAEVSMPAGTRVIRRFLAARAFASWFAYQSGGPAGVQAALRLTLGLLRERMRAHGASEARADAALKESVRETDLQMLHLADRDALARRVERLASRTDRSRSPALSRPAAAGCGGSAGPRS